jgi:excisionase family DNA binding protein
MITSRSVEERLQTIEEYLLEIKSMLKPATISQKQIIEPEGLISVKDAAKLGKIDSVVIYGACKRNELPYIRLGKLYKFRKQDFLKWLNAQNNSPNNAVDDYVNKYLQKHLLKG